MSYRSNWGRTRPEPDMDPGDCNDQLELDVGRLAETCRHCGTTRKSLCGFDADVAHGLENPGPRPRRCLVRPNPATSEWPAGY